MQDYVSLSYTIMLHWGIWVWSSYYVRLLGQEAQKGQHCKSALGVLAAAKKPKHANNVTVTWLQWVALFALSNSLASIGSKFESSNVWLANSCRFGLACLHLIFSYVFIFFHIVSWISLWLTKDIAGSSGEVHGIWWRSRLQGHCGPRTYNLE